MALYVSGLGAIERQNTKTDAFRRWFKDSVVRNPDGSPMAVYHGTRHYLFDRKDPKKPSPPFVAFNEFKPMAGRDFPDIGMHFGSKETAGEFVGSGDPDRSSNARIYPVYLSIQKPIVMEDQTVWVPSDLAAQFYSRYQILTPQEYDYIVEPDVEFYDAHPSYLNENPAVQKQMRIAKEAEVRVRLIKTLNRRGYDGIVYINRYEGPGSRFTGFGPPDPASISWIVFRPNQIKSVFNRGTFDPNDNDILNGLRRR